MNFASRSYQQELLDGNNISFQDIKKNMQELEAINTLLGGHAITIRGFRKCAGTLTKINVCEIGCGGGDNLKAIYKYASDQGIVVTMTGIDIKRECIDYAKDNCQSIQNMEWICADYKQASLTSQPDIIFSSLFCHHFTDQGVEEILQWMAINAGVGFFINDLHRHPLAYYSIKILTRIFSNSHLVKNDAPLSVLRGFRKKELLDSISKSSVENKNWQIELKWQWAFRWLMTARKKEGFNEH